MINRLPLLTKTGNAGLHSQQLQAMTVVHMGLAMDINTILIELHAQRSHIEQAIAALERVGKKKRRGRPPKWMSPSAIDKQKAAQRKMRATDNLRVRARVSETSKSPA